MSPPPTSTNKANHYLLLILFHQDLSATDICGKGGPSDMIRELWNQMSESLQRDYGNIQGLEEIIFTCDCCMQMAVTIAK